MPSASAESAQRLLGLVHLRELAREDDDEQPDEGDRGEGLEDLHAVSTSPMRYARSHDGQRAYAEKLLRNQAPGFVPVAYMDDELEEWVK